MSCEPTLRVDADWRYCQMTPQNSRTWISRDIAIRLQFQPLALTPGKKEAFEERSAEWIDFGSAFQNS